MTMHKIIKKYSLVLLIVIFTFLGSMTFAKTTHLETTIASIDNLDDEEFRTDEGNLFKLIKVKEGCKIEAQFYVSFENTLYSYTFKNNILISGYEKKNRYNYLKDHEGSLLHVTDFYQYSSAHYNVNDPNVKKDFMRYKALFSKHALAQC